MLPSGAWLQTFRGVFAVILFLSDRGRSQLTQDFIFFDVVIADKTKILEADETLFNELRGMHSS